MRAACIFSKFTAKISLHTVKGSLICTLSIGECYLMKKI